jgi:D-glycero-D-manno-heptose 1,7-bisphosphate phosphatase
MNRAVFLDRDGTLNVERNYLSDPAHLEVLPGTGPALRRLSEAGFKLFIITNQSGIGRGYYTEGDMHRVNARLSEVLAADGVRFEKIYFSPESPEQPSRTRKPSPQLLFDARDEFGLDLAQSYMIGDKIIDLECGWNAGVKKSILVRTGYGAEVEAKAAGRIAAAKVVEDLPRAAEWILSQDAGHVGPAG